MSRHWLLLMAVFSTALAYSADSVTYDFSVDTSSITGTSGALDFQFNPGPTTYQSASLEISNFSSDGTLINPSYPTGDVAGSLPGTLTFDNGNFFNDYFQDFTYGSQLSFQVSLSGPALSSPDGVSTSGTTFAFSMFSDPAGTIPTLTSDTVNGFATLINVNLDGTTSVINNSSQTMVVPETSSVPEPSSLLLLMAALPLIALKRSRLGTDRLP